MIGGSEAPKRAYDLKERRRGRELGRSKVGFHAKYGM